MDQHPDLVMVHGEPMDIRIRGYELGHVLTFSSKSFGLPQIEVVLVDIFGAAADGSVVEVSFELLNFNVSGNPVLFGTRSKVTTRGVAVFDDLSVNSGGYGLLMLRVDVTRGLADSQGQHIFLSVVNRKS